MSMSSKTSTVPDLSLTTRFVLSASSIFSDASRRSNGTVNRFLFNLVDLKVSPSKKPVNGVSTYDVTVDPSRKLWFRLFIPNNQASNGDTKLPVIFFFHGGGFVFLAANSKPYDDFCRRLAKELPAIIVSVDYRLAPEHRFPSQYEDGFDVIKFIDERGFDSIPVNADLGRCFLAGDSAGANLAHHAVLKVTESNFEKVKVIGIVAIQPFFGGEERTESEIRLDKAPIVNVERTDWIWKAFLPEGSDRDHPVANVFGPNAKDISGVKFPATVVFIGGFDPLQDWQRRYFKGLKKCGHEAYLIEYPNAIHTFYAFPDIPESSLFLEEVRTFMQKQLDRSRSD